MPGLLADVNAEGPLGALLAVCRAGGWHDLWQDIGVTVYTFADLGLDRDVPDRELWRTCQHRGIMLVTGNRHRDDPDSLQATIATETRPGSLPVLTLADPNRVMVDRAYAERAAVRMMEILTDLDQNRGTGRLWLP